MAGALASLPLLSETGIGNAPLHPQAKPESFLEIFSSCSKLESLSLAIHISDPQWFSAARDRAKLARGGGASLVRKFTVGADPSAVFIDWDSGVAIPALSGLGNAFPELEELRVSTVYPREFWLHFGFGGGGAQGAWAPLPRLRLVEINGIGVYFKCVAVVRRFALLLLGWGCWFHHESRPPR